jgi:hypothetical protein
MSHEILLVIIASLFIILIIPNLYKLAKSDNSPNYIPPPIEYLNVNDRVVVKLTGETGVIRNVIHVKRPEHGDFNEYYVELDTEYRKPYIYFKRNEIDTAADIRKKKIQNLVYGV